MSMPICLELLAHDLAGLEQLRVLRQAEILDRQRVGDAGLGEERLGLLDVGPPAYDVPSSNHGEPVGTSATPELAGAEVGDVADRRSGRPPSATAWRTFGLSKGGAVEFSARKSGMPAVGVVT